MKLPLVLVLLFACTISSHQGVLADIICENLPTNVCAFAVSSSGKRCVLENSIKDGGKVGYECKTSSEVVVGRDRAEYLETDKCVGACGVDRKSVGMSSDALLDPAFIARLCSPECYNNCPNIVDLYFNLAAAEGVYLPETCQKQQQAAASRLRRDMIELESDDDSSGGDNNGAPIDVLAVDYADADAPMTSADAPIAADILGADILAVDYVDGPVADAPIGDDVLGADVFAVDYVEAPTQPRNARRELSSNGVANADAPAPAPAVDDTPAPSPSYFF